MNKYFVTIGLEMHVEGSKTKSKVFSPSSNSFSDLPNSNVVEIDMGFPGILPSVNKQAVKDAIKVSLLLNSRIADYLYFERKNYYYPDLPKGYQITQNPPEECIGNGGYIDIEREDKSIFRVEIDNLHLEEDSARSTHHEKTTTLNYNRAGAPLFELVTKPCIHSASDAIYFLEYIRNIYRYCDVSEADAKKGQIRVDVNISLSNEEGKLGTKVETKNVNSFSSVKDVINYEIQRQTKLFDEGRENEIVQETRRWDEEKQATVTMRSKEDALDYKYFVEPNIPRIKIDKEWVEEIKSSLSILPNERKHKYIDEFEISENDAIMIVKDKEISDYFDKCLLVGIEAKDAVNYLKSSIITYLNKTNESINDIYLSAEMLKFIIDTLKEGKISSKQAKEIIEKVLIEKKDAKEFINEDNAQISDEKELSRIIDEIILDKSEQVTAYKNGKDKLFGFFVGEVMKVTKGKANPVISNKILHDKLDN